MGREIKFRAWDGEKMYLFNFESLMGGDDGSVSIDRSMFGLDITDNSLKIMQYTGLKDKNGKEIYEGDIVKIWDYYAEVGVVEYNPPRFNIFDNDDSTTDFDNIEWKYFGVIGNIYENPDLLSKLLKED